jgi:CIC family chloride channel protein
MVLHLLLGDDPLFHVAGYRLVHPAEFAIYAILGVVGGLGSVAFTKLLLGLRAFFKKLPARTVWAQPVVGGLSVGIMGFFIPAVLGVGYNQVEKVLNGQVVLETVIVLAILKLIATAVCYSSGNAGGIFGPSLFIGAMMGASVGSVAHAMFPAYTAGAGAYALVGMGTAFAGIVRTPLTSVIMIFEVTRDYSIIVPLMISNLIAFFISQRLQRQPIYEALAHQDGVHLPTIHSRAQPEWSRVKTAMRTAPLVLPSDWDVSTALAHVKDAPFDAWPVTDNLGLRGMIRESDLENATAVGKKVFEVIETESDGVPHLHPDQSLSFALERMGATGFNVLPVVSRADVKQLVGVVALEDILGAYRVAGKRDEEEK